MNQTLEIANKYPDATVNVLWTNTWYGLDIGAVDIAPFGPMVSCQNNLA